MNRHESNKQSKQINNRPWFLFLGIALLSCLLVVFFMPRSVNAPDLKTGPVQTVREPVDFQMSDFSHGWFVFKDGVLTTEDSGAHWSETGSASLPQASLQTPALEGTPDWMRGTLPNPDTITVQTRDIKVKKSQFLTENLGWAMTANEGQGSVPLWVTTDSGKTWSNPVTPETLKEIEAERLRLLNMVKESNFYIESETARKAIQADWLLIPDTAAPGDIVLVRHRSKETVAWQGKSYELQPFGSGYFTYLPIPINTKPGVYTIGDRTLTVKAKKFDTQYLQVTKQLESMRQDTKRIVEDQKKINQARSESKPEFLFSSPFVQPVDGILTTPYGYTRYVNGKFDSSHMAVDLAAKEGTPIKATNDGVVVLAESLYLTGNSIYIDHGMNLFSQYAHMSELKVKTGDFVKQGDIIGLVGTTGFSTGPHLHFTFWAHNMPVNPNLFFGTTPFRWLQTAP